MKPTFRKCFCLLFGMLFVIPVLAKQESISMDSLVVNIAAIEELSQVYLQLQTDTNKLAVLEKVKIAFEQSKECEIDTLTIKLGKFISDCYYFDYDSLSTSLQYSYEIFPLAKKTDLKSAAVIANDIAYIYSEFSDWENSLKYYIQANDFYEASADSTMTNYVLGNISNIYFSIKDYPKSMYYNNLALSKSKQLAEPAKSYSMYYDYTQLAAIYLETNQIDSAQFYYSEALKQVNQYLPLAKKKEDSILLVMVLNHLAKFYHETNDFQQSKVYIDSTLTLLSEEKGFYHTNKIYIDIVTLLIEQNHIQDSKKYLDKVGNTLNKKEKITEYLKYETALTNYYEVIQNYQLAFISQKKIDSLKSEINTKEKLRQAELANAKFLQAKREAQVANQIALFEKQAKVDKEKLEQQRLTSLVTFALMALLMLFIVGLASMLLYINKKKKKYTQQLKDEVSLKTQKLASINNDLIQTNYELQHFNHIISHDLKEPLRTIVSFSNLAVRRLV